MRVINWQCLAAAILSVANVRLAREKLLEKIKLQHTATPQRAADFCVVLSCSKTWD